MHPLGLRELTQSSCGLAEHAHIHLAAFEVKEKERFTVEDHVWLTNTSSYCAWMDPPVGAATSTFLWCSSIQLSNFGFTFWGQSRRKGTDTLYFDRREDVQIPLAERKIFSNYPNITSSTTIILL